MLELNDELLNIIINKQNLIFRRKRLFEFENLSLTNIILNILKVSSTRWENFTRKLKKNSLNKSFLWDCLLSFRVRTLCSMRYIERFVYCFIDDQWQIFHE